MNVEISSHRGGGVMVIAFVIGTAVGYVCRSFLRSGEASLAYYEGVIDGIKMESWYESRKEGE